MSLSGTRTPLVQAPADAVRRVLLVDDEPAAVRAMRLGLEGRGYDVAGAFDGDDALAQFERVAFDAVVTDLAMPRRDGLALLRELRRRSPDVPVIVVTGAEDEASARAAVAEGALMYLTKPVDVGVLEQVLAYATTLHRAQLPRASEPSAATAGTQDLAAAFADAVARLWIAFQPIVRAEDRTVFGWEALVRSDSPSLGDPRSLFAAAEQLGETARLGRAIRARVAQAIPRGPEGALIFVNVHREDLLDDALLGDDDPLRPFASRLVLEITERNALDEMGDVAGRVERLRSLGFRIAVDDLGSGYAGLNSFAQLKPWVVKIDMTLVRGIDHDAARSSIVRAVVELCRDTGVEVIAEGVETDAERITLDDLGCRLQQGYAYARPSRGFAQP